MMTEKKKINNNNRTPTHKGTQFRMKYYFKSMLFACMRYAFTNLLHDFSMHSSLNGFLQFLSFPHFTASFSYSCDSCFVRFFRLWKFVHPFNRSVCAFVCAILFSSFLFIFLFRFSAFFFTNERDKSSVLHKWKVKCTVIFRPFFPTHVCSIQLTMFECNFIIFKAKFCFSIEYFFFFQKKEKKNENLKNTPTEHVALLKSCDLYFLRFLSWEIKIKWQKKKRENWIGSVWKFIPLRLFRITTFMTNVFDGIRSFLPAKILDFHYIFMPLLNSCLYFCTQKSSGMNF